MSRPSPASRNSGSALAIVSGVAGMLFGIIVGYLLATQPGASRFSSTAEAAAPAAATAATTPVVNDSELQAYKDILKADPKNTRVATDLANRLYDAGRYSEAIPYYQQAFANDPKNVMVSTDLATSLFYAGRSDEALAQFDKSLSINPNHAQTLFNVGIVKRDGKNDPKGAIAAWERLLTAAPDYPDAAKVRSMIGELKART